MIQFISKYALHYHHCNLGVVAVCKPEMYFRSLHVIKDCAVYDLNTNTNTMSHGSRCLCFLFFFCTYTLSGIQWLLMLVSLVQAQGPTLSFELSFLLCAMDALYNSSVIHAEFM